LYYYEAKAKLHEAKAKLLNDVTELDGNYCKFSPEVFNLFRPNCPLNLNWLYGLWSKLISSYLAVIYLRKIVTTECSFAKEESKERLCNRTVECTLVMNKCTVKNGYYG